MSCECSVLFWISKLRLNTRTDIFDRYVDFFPILLQKRQTLTTSFNFQKSFLCTLPKSTILMEVASEFHFKLSILKWLIKILRYFSRHFKCSDEFSWLRSQNPLIRTVMYPTEQITNFEEKRTGGKFRKIAQNLKSLDFLTHRIRWFVIV